MGLAFGAALLLQAGAELAVGGWPDGGRVAVGVTTFLVAVSLASWVLMERVEGMPVAALGLPVDACLPRDLTRGFLVGAGLIGLAVAGLHLAGWVGWSTEAGGPSATGLAGSFLQLTSFFLVAALAEEILVRGYPLQALARAWGGRAAIAATAVAFSLLHLLNPGAGSSLLESPSLSALLPLANIGLAGVVLGLAYWRTYSLWFATGVHFGWNWTMGWAADLPVSGLGSGTPGYGFLDTPGWEAVVSGPDLWTGGRFGPEGGLAVTVASLVAIAWLARTPRLARALRVRAMDPLPDQRPSGPAPSPPSGSRRGGPSAAVAGEGSGGGPGDATVGPHRPDASP